MQQGQRTIDVSRIELLIGGGDDFAIVLVHAHEFWQTLTAAQRQLGVDSRRSTPLALLPNSNPAAMMTSAAGTGAGAAVFKVAAPSAHPETARAAEALV